jgi:hypothetical protein
MRRIATTQQWDKIIYTDYTFYIVKNASEG